MLFQVLDCSDGGCQQKETHGFSLGVSLLAAQILAGLGTNGVSLGKRDLSEAELRGFFDTLGNSILNGLQSVWSNVIQNPLEQALQSTSTSINLRLVPHTLILLCSGTALMAAQVLAGLGVNGVSLGKREARGEIFNNLVDHASGLYATQVKPVVESALNSKSTAPFEFSVDSDGIERSSPV